MVILSKRKRSNWERQDDTSHPPAGVKRMERPGRSSAGVSRVDRVGRAVRSRISPIRAICVIFLPDRPDRPDQPDPPRTVPSRRSSTIAGRVKPRSAGPCGASRFESAPGRGWRSTGRTLSTGPFDACELQRQCGGANRTSTNFFTFSPSGRRAAGTQTVCVPCGKPVHARVRMSGPPARAVPSPGEHRTVGGQELPESANPYGISMSIDELSRLNMYSGSSKSVVE